MILNNDVLGIIYEFIVINKCMSCNRKKPLYESFLDQTMIEIKPVYCNKCYKQIYNTHSKILTTKWKAKSLNFKKYQWLRWLNPNDKGGRVCENVLRRYYRFHYERPRKRTAYLLEQRGGLTIRQQTEYYIKSCNDRDIFQFFNHIDINLYQNKITGKMIKTDEKLRTQYFLG